MPAETVYCHVLQGNVSVVSNINGQITNVICPKFYRIYYSCDLKDKDHGFISGTLARVTDRFAGTRHVYCEFTGPKD